MKKIIILLISLILSTPIFSESKQSRDIDSIFKELMTRHERFLSGFFDQQRVNPFERTFFQDISFTNNMQTVSFFENLKTNLDNGKTPNFGGRVQISYMSYSNINGVPSAVSYEYKSDGKNIILTKGTLVNGEMLKAVYNYNPSGKQLEAQEIQGNKVISKNTYKYEI